MLSSGYRKFTALCVAATAFMLFAGTAQAANVEYPKGGGSFNGGAEGWETTEAGCNLPALCTAGGAYDGGVGNPAGSLAATTNIALNVVSLFKSSVTFVSPNFKVTEDGTAVAHVDRQFSQGNLVDLNPSLDYSVRLIDRTANNESTPIKETVASTSPFTGVDHASSVVAGHTYALAVTAEISSSVAGTGLLAGSTSAHFDNVSLSVQTSGDGNGSGGGKGSGTGAGVGSAELRSLIASSLIGPAILKGNKISVKARCAAAIGVPCKITLRGMLKKRKAATSARKAQVGKGKTKKFVLRVKPKALSKVARSKRLLFKETVRAGKAKATVYKRLKLVRR